MSVWRFAPLGEAAWMARCELPDLALANRFAHALARALEASPAFEVLLGLRSVTVRFDPLSIEPESALVALQRICDQLEPAPEVVGHVHRVPVRYGGEAGPDLESAAQALGLTPAQLIALHTSQPWRVLMLGFAPGFAYLGPLPAMLHLPRRATPRPRVPAGSVAIAGGLTGIYPSELPGGWHLIGRTELTLFDAHREPPTWLQPGDAVLFVAL